MLIDIKKDIFERDNLSDLNYIIRILSYKGRYDFYADYDVVVNLQNFNKLDELDKLNIEEQFNKFMTESSQPNLVISENNNANDYTLVEAIHFLNQPVLIVVENRLNDGHFVKAIIKHFDKKGTIVKHLENRWLKIENAGGKNNFINYLKAELKTYRSLPKPNHRYLRVFVIADSDKKSPNSDPKNQNLIDFLRENDIKSHILQKREIENYLPNETIGSILDNREFVDAYLRLDSIQKDYFDLEKGFDKRRKFEDLPEEIKKLYKNISEGDKKIFRKQDLESKYKNQGQSFKSEFPKLFHHKTVTKKSLLNRCKHHSNNPSVPPYNPNELPELVEKIAKLL